MNLNPTKHIRTLVLQRNVSTLHRRTVRHRLPVNPRLLGRVMMVPVLESNSPDSGSTTTKSENSDSDINSWSNQHPLASAAITTVVGLAAVFIGGIAYVSWYKARVLDKIELAFAPGYDPALELASHSVSKQPQEDKAEGATWSGHMRRKEQDIIDAIIHGERPGGYYILLGPKGSGKATMIFDAMSVNQADGVAVVDAHPDLEVFRLRLGKALNYEYNEDSQTSLFQRRDPREAGPQLDIERGLNKLEKVALRSARKTGKPLVLVINNVHFFKNDDEGRNLLLQLQHRAEAWAASGIMTLVFSSDDFWPFLLLRKSANRMHTLSITDLSAKEAYNALLRMRRCVPPTSVKANISPECESSNISRIINIIGGRLLHLGKVSKAPVMLDQAQHMLQVEKAWLQSQIGLIPDHDDDVMDEQKWSSCSWLLLQEFVKLKKEQEERGESGDLELPSIPYWRCRQIMTRPDFLEDLDRANIIQIDYNLDVRPDSFLVLHAAREVVEEEGFEEVLDNVRARVDEIESLHRTRELTFKDLEAGDTIRLSVDKGERIV